MMRKVKWWARTNRPNDFTPPGVPFHVVLIFHPLFFLLHSPLRLFLPLPFTSCKINSLPSSTGLGLFAASGSTSVFLFQASALYSLPDSIRSSFLVQSKAKKCMPFILFSGSQTVCAGFCSLPWPLFGTLVRVVGNGVCVCCCFRFCE